MAGLTQRLQVVLVVGAAVIKWQNMVHFLRRCDSAVGFALFAQRVGCDVTVADLPPGMTITLIDLRVALEAAVATLMLSRVGVAVAVD